VRNAKRPHMFHILKFLFPSCRGFKNRQKATFHKFFEKNFFRPWGHFSFFDFFSEKNLKIKYFYDFSFWKNDQHISESAKKVLQPQYIKNIFWKKMGYVTLQNISKIN
jgi:hypothetical protein